MVFHALCLCLNSSFFILAVSINLIEIVGTISITNESVLFCDNELDLYSLDLSKSPRRNFSMR